MLFQAVAICQHHRVGCLAVGLRSLAVQPVDDLAQDAGDRFGVIGVQVPRFLGGCQDGQEEVGKQQGHDDGARGKEDDQVAFWEQAAVVEHEGQREDDGKGDSAFGAADRGKQGRLGDVLAQTLALACGGVFLDGFHDAKPNEAHGNQDCCDGDDAGDEGEVADAAVVPGGKHCARQLHAQKHEHDAVQGEGHHLPYVVGDDVQA